MIFKIKFSVDTTSLNQRTLLKMKFNKRFSMKKTFKSSKSRRDIRVDDDEMGKSCGLAFCLAGALFAIIKCIEAL